MGLYGSGLPGTECTTETLSHCMAVGSIAQEGALHGSSEKEHSHRSSSAAWEAGSAFLVGRIQAQTTSSALEGIPCVEIPCLVSLLCAHGNLSVSLSRLLLVKGMGVVGTGRKWVCPRKEVGVS